MRMASSEQALQAVEVARAEGWQEDAFHTVFHLHYPAIVGVVARMLGDRALAEEVADDAFWRLYGKPQLAGAGNNVAGWLYRTATRLALDHLRARRRGWNRRARVEAETVAAAEGDPLQALERGEQVARVRRALARLRPRQAQMLVLRHSGLAYVEIALALGMKASSVGTTLARAERLFQRLYEEEM